MAGAPAATPRFTKFFCAVLFAKRRLLIFRSLKGAEGGGGMALSAGGGEWTECRERIAVRDAVYGR